MATVKVEKASLAPEFDSYNSEGYQVVIELDGKRIGASTANNANLEPQWDQEVQLTQRDISRGKCLTFKVYVSRKFRFNTLCGSVDVDLRHALDARGSMQLRLIRKSDNTGIINITCARSASL